MTATTTRTVRTDDGVRLHVEVDDGPAPTVVMVHGFTARFLEETPLTVSAAFYRTLLDRDEQASLAALADVPVTLLVGDALLRLLEKVHQSSAA